MWQNEADTAAF